MTDNGHLSKNIKFTYLKPKLVTHNPAQDDRQRTLIKKFTYLKPKLLVRRRFDLMTVRVSETGALLQLELLLVFALRCPRLCWLEPKLPQTEATDFRGLKHCKCSSYLF